MPLNLNLLLMFLMFFFLTKAFSLAPSSSFFYLLSSSVSSRSYRSGYSSSFLPFTGNRHRSPSFLSKGLNSHELCVRLQRKSGRSSVFMQDGAVVTKSNATESKSSLKGLKEKVLSVLSKEAAKVGGESDGPKQSTVSITVVGASGDLAKKKIFPALFALYYKGCLPEHFYDIR